MAIYVHAMIKTDLPNLEQKNKEGMDKLTESLM